jgi:hypothetical protein
VLCSQRVNYLKFGLKKEGRVFKRVLFSDFYPISPEFLVIIIFMS